MNKVQTKTIVFALLASAFILASCAGSANNNSSGGSTGTVTSVIITDTIETSGNLDADKLSQLTWGTSGVVDKINVTAGQKVKTGDVLAVLRLDSVPATVVTAQSDLESARRNLQDLLDSKTSQAQAQQDVLAAQKALETAQVNLDAMSYPRASDLLIQNQQAKIWAAQKKLTLATNNYKAVDQRSDGDPAKTQAIINLTNAQLELNSLVATYNWYTGKATQADMDQARADLETAKAALADAQRARDNVKNGPDTVTITNAQSKIDAAQATVNTMQIIAPFDGEILAVQSGAGNSVAIDDAALAIVDRNTLKIDTQIDETGIAQVVIGDKASITMDSLAGVTLTGKVTTINPIGANVNGLVKYTVTISVDPTDKPVLFGATANVVLTTSEPRPMLAVPFGAVQTDTRGEYVVTIAPDGSSQRVAITSGNISGNVVTVTPTGNNNLKEGDQVEVGIASSSNNGANQQGGGGGVRIPGLGGGG